ncbi:hypothetical protein TGDOM2_312840 [Toxoplasma gondii GAB2-2007-GAL-DOM2]|uniref:Uncharacterized protein n=2 Tax=Toxoplasma gondii TaxID=5811 RepID=A0A086KI54_TOXGO|nr:hypothetical protein TGDOM2_312840 [Toxoplasma gondii GAB2-2007-GAL-DOM2]
METEPPALPSGRLRELSVFLDGDARGEAVLLREKKRLAATSFEPEPGVCTPDAAVTSPPIRYETTLFSSLPGSPSVAAEPLDSTSPDIALETKVFLEAQSRRLSLASFDPTSLFLRSPPLSSLSSSSSHCSSSSSSSSSPSSSSSSASSASSSVHSPRKSIETLSSPSGASSVYRQPRANERPSMKRQRPPALVVPSVVRHGGADPREKTGGEPSPQRVSPQRVSPQRVSPKRVSPQRGQHSRSLPPLPPSTSQRMPDRSAPSVASPRSLVSTKGAAKGAPKERTPVRDELSKRKERNADLRANSAAKAALSFASNLVSSSPGESSSDAGSEENVKVSPRKKKGGSADALAPSSLGETSTSLLEKESCGAKEERCGVKKPGESRGRGATRTCMRLTVCQQTAPAPRSPPPPRPHLILPAVLGDPIFSVDLDAGVGVVAGSLLGRVSAHLFGRQGQPSGDSGVSAPCSPPLALLFASPAKAKRASFSRQRVKRFLAAMPGTESFASVKNAAEKTRRVASSVLWNSLHPTAVTRPPPLHPHCYCQESEKKKVQETAEEREEREERESKARQEDRREREPRGAEGPEGNADETYANGIRRGGKATAGRRSDGGESEETGRKAKGGRSRGGRGTGQTETEVEGCLENGEVESKVETRLRDWRRMRTLLAPLLPLRMFKRKKTEKKEEEASCLCTTLLGLFVLFAAYGDDACSCVSISPTCTYAVFGMNEIVRWGSDSLKCLGGERVSPSQFAPHRASHSSTTFFVSRHPLRASRRSLTEGGRIFAGGGGVGMVISLGCDAYADLQRFFCIPLWKSLEANSMVVVDFDGTFLLCVMGDCISRSRYFYLVDLRGACTREFKENYGWAASRKNLVHKFVAYRREAPKHFALAKLFRNSFVLVCEDSSANRIAVYDASASILQHSKERQRHAEEVRRKRECQSKEEDAELEDLPPWDEDALCDDAAEGGSWDADNFDPTKNPVMPIDRASPVHTFLGHLTSIVAVDASREDDLLLSLGSDAKLFLWRWKFTAPLMVFDCSPASFSLGWPWVLVSHEDMVAFSCDHGVYAMQLSRNTQPRSRRMPLSRSGKNVSSLTGGDFKREVTGTVPAAETEPCTRGN